MIADLTISVVLARKAAARVDDELVRELALNTLQLSDNGMLNVFRANLEKLLEATIAVQLDEHFLSDTDVEQFDQAKLTDSDKNEIRGHLENARRLTNLSKVLPDDHKRRICHRIAKAENELFKEIAGFNAFIAAAYDTSDLVKQFGKDVMPIAEAVEKARTVTEKKVQGYQQQIGVDEKPKQLPKPDEEP